MKQTKLVEITDIEKQKGILEEAGRIIRHGGLVVFPTETVYGIGANGLDADACRSIYVAKGRPSDNPLILTVPDEEGARQAAAVIPPTAQKLMDRFWPGPLTIVLPRKPIVPGDWRPRYGSSALPGPRYLPGFPALCRCPRCRSQCQLVDPAQSDDGRRSHARHGWPRRYGHRWRPLSYRRRIDHRRM